MNLTDMKCTLKFLGWELQKKRRESIWNDPNITNSNYISFEDHNLIVYLNRNRTRYSYIGTDFQKIINEVMETINND